METAEEKPKEVPLRVAVRVRPFNAREIQVLPENIIEMSGGTLTVTNPESKDSRQYTFDSCHWSHDGFIVNQDGIAVPGDQGSRYSGQEAIFKDIGVSTVEKALEGYNVAIFAYGPTGTGKSHTMLGRSPDYGLVHRCCDYLFSQIDDNPQINCKVTFSILEIYNENIIDLLSKTNAPLKIRQRRHEGVFVQDLTEMPVRSASQIEELLMQSLMNRTVAATLMNSSSSRSHLVVTIQFMQFITEYQGKRIRRQSRIRFIDMAGSERASKTGATGMQLMEAKTINKSVAGFGSIISTLAGQRDGKKTFIPYRNSRFTHLLSEELGGNCVTTLIAAISPASVNYDETISTLEMVKRARKVSQKLVVNDLDVDVAIASDKNQITQLKIELASAEPGEAKTSLQESIDTLTVKLQQLEAPWKEKQSKEKGGIWWSPFMQLQTTELETTPYIQNISEDSQLSGVVKHIVSQGPSLLGSSDTDNVKIKLSGLGIQPLHAILVNSGTSLSIAPCSHQATVHVNGVPVRAVTMLNHGDRIKLGACELFTLIGFPSSRTPENLNAAKHLHEKCLEELAKNHPLYHQIMPSASASLRARTAALTLFQEFTDLLLQLAQAHGIAANFGKHMDFEAELSRNEKPGEHLHVRVIDRKLGMEWVWSKAKFENQKLTMDELNEELISIGKAPQLKKNNPFCDASNEDILIGRCTISLHNIAFGMPVDDEVPVLDDCSGKQMATVHVIIKPCISQGSPSSPQEILKDPKDLVGKPLELSCTTFSFHDVFWVTANPQRGVYCTAWIAGETETLLTETVYGAINGQFKGNFQFTFDTVTQKQIDFFQMQGLLLELWGTQTPLSSNPSTQTSPQHPPQNVPLASEEDETIKNSTSGLVLDLDLAQDLRQFFRNVCPVQQKLQDLKKRVDENSQAQGGQPLSWADCSSQLQAARTELDKCVLSLKDSVKTAIRHSKQT